MIRSLLRALANGFLHVTLSEKCIFCGGEQQVAADLGTCESCAKKLPYANSYYNSQLRGCLGFAVPFYYREPVRHAIHSFKFNNGTAHCLYLAMYLAQCIRRQIKAPVDYITWVPVSRLRRWRRGYDQVERLAREVSALTGIPCVPTLKKVIHTRAQSSLPPAEKRKLPKGVYRIRQELPPKDCTLLLLDDVITSGTTMHAALTTLQRAGFHRIYIGAIARSH